MVENTNPLGKGITKIMIGMAWGSQETQETVAEETVTEETVSEGCGIVQASRLVFKFLCCCEII